MAAIHLVERLGDLRKVDATNQEWESGFWVVGEDTAQRLVGGDIYLHEGQNEPSHFGGRIVSYRVHRGDDVDGRIVFRFRAAMEYRGVRTGRAGWGNEKKIVW